MYAAEHAAKHYGKPWGWSPPAQAAHKGLSLLTPLLQMRIRARTPLRRPAGVNVFLKKDSQSGHVIAQLRTPMMMTAKTAARALSSVSLPCLTLLSLSVRLLCLLFQEQLVLPECKRIVSKRPLGHMSPLHCKGGCSRAARCWLRAPKLLLFNCLERNTEQLGSTSNA